MEQLNDNKIICHIVGLNPSDKSKISELCNNISKYHLIDLDEINNEILTDETMNKLFKTYSKLKKSKNDKFKDIDKKMTKYWEDNMVKKVYDLIPGKKKTILVGKNHHYRLLSKKINFLVSNKFIIDNNIKDEVKARIKYNLLTHHDEIVNGRFPIDFLNYKQQLKKRQLFEESYTKTGYTKIKLETLLEILNVHSKKKIKGEGLWLSLKEPYNIGSKIHTNKEPIYAFIDPVLSLIGSFNFKEEDINYNFNEDKVISLNNIDSKKMKKGRYLYYVSKEDFILADIKNKHRYSTHNPVLVLEKEKINNVYNKLVELELLN